MMERFSESNHPVLWHGESGAERGAISYRPVTDLAEREALERLVRAHFYPTAVGMARPDDPAGDCR